MTEKLHITSIIIFFLTAVFGIVIGITVLACGKKLPLSNVILAKYERQLIQKRTKIAALQTQNNQLINENKTIRKITANAAAATDIENLEMFFRETLEQAAANSGIELKSSGNMVKQAPTELYSTLEISINGNGNLKEFLHFVNDLSQSHPRIYFKSLTVNTGGNPEKPLNFNGLLTIIKFEQSGFES